MHLVHSSTHFLRLKMVPDVFGVLHFQHRSRFRCRIRVLLRLRLRVSRIGVLHVDFLCSPPILSSDDDHHGHNEGDEGHAAQDAADNGAYFDAVGCFVVL